MPYKILIVEDEQITAEDLRDILTSQGYTVTAVVSNGLDALLQAETNPPDLVLMDIRIKGNMDGTETARILRQRHDIPVVYLTAHADRETLARAKQAEPLGYIIKPFQESGLQASIEVAIHKHQEDKRARTRANLLESTLSGMGEAVISVDRKGNVTFMNPASERWTGWTNEEARGKHIDGILKLVDSGVGEPVDAPVGIVLDEETIAEFNRVLLSDRSGGKRPVGGNVSPIRDHNGGITGAVIVFGDVREPAPPHGRAATSQANTEELGEFGLVAASTAMKKVLHFARRVAESEASTILLEGESGTGKDVLAQFMHHFGKRHAAPFIAMNCAAIPETLLESELFGHEKGAFTDAKAQKRGLLEMATGGTIFLDEIGEMPVLLQAKMLRVIEDQRFRRLGGVRDIQVDVRVVAATNRRLADAINQGRFRLDLYYRLNVIQVVLPPLRDRRDDILPLARYFIGVLNIKFKREIKGLADTAAEALLAYEWPGNVRELRNTIERAMVLEETDWIEPASLLLEVQYADPGTTQTAPSSAAKPEASEPPSPFSQTLEDAERTMIIQALQKADWNQTQAASLLGISRDTIRYKIKKFGLHSPEKDAH